MTGQISSRRDRETSRNGDLTCDMEEYHRLNWVRSPAPGVCGEPWAPAPFGMAHNGDDAENMSV